MGAEEKNRNEILSRIVADLFVKSKGGEDLSQNILRLRGEIKKVIESEGTIFGKLRELVESFREIIPEEKQRYNAAIKALSTTAKISRQDIVTAVNSQLEELKILEKGLLYAPSGGRNELEAMEAKSRELRDEISKLREKIGRLESEEKELLTGMTAREKQTELVSKAVGELFADIAAEITDINKKVQEVSAESAVSQPIPPGDSIKSDIFPVEKGGGGQKNEIIGSSAPRDTELQKKCPMCGGRMDLYISERKWRCYSCAYEEFKEEKGGGERKNEILEPSAPRDTELQKKCPMCGGRMDFYINEKKWICFSCAFEESGTGDVQGEREEIREHTNAPEPTPASEPIFDPFPPLAVPSASLSSPENQEPIKGSIPGSSPSHKQPSTKKKTCPVCRKKMNWHQEDKAWRCPYCDYERRI
jgi:ssDNA-binding Zn-finger/Zn-ribbon topoisomerase 1